MKFLITAMLLSATVILYSCSDNKTSNRPAGKGAVVTDSAKESTIRDLDTAADAIGAGQVVHP